MYSLEEMQNEEAELEKKYLLLVQILGDLIHIYLGLICQYGSKHTMTMMKKYVQNWIDMSTLFQRVLTHMLYQKQ